MILKPWFRAAFFLMVGFCVFVALYLPKMWKTSPEGFMPEVKISWLDMTQCWSLKRAARNAAAAGDFEKAEHSWHMAVAQNPGDLTALRGYLDNFTNLARPDERQVDTAVRQMHWLLRIDKTNRADVVRLARLADKFGWHEVAAHYFERLRGNLPPEAEVVYIKGLFHQRRFKEFQERWVLSRGRLSDPSLNIYERAYTMGWGKGEEAAQAARDLEAASQDAVLGPRAARLYMFAAGQQGNVTAYEKALQRLTALNSARVDDHTTYWNLLAHSGRKEEAIRLAEAHTTSPRNAYEMVRMADAYNRLGMTAACREVLSRFIRLFSSAPEGWTYYASFLQEMQDWPELRNVALMIRDQSQLFSRLWGYSYFLEGLSDHRRNVHTGAAAAFQRAAEATYEVPAMGYYVARELLKLKYSAQALKILQGIESSYDENSEFWETYFNAAYGARDSVAVLKAAEQSYQLNSQDPQLRSRYAAALMLNRKDPEESIKLTLQLVNAYPESLGAKINHGFALLLNKREQEARELLETLVFRTMDPIEANALHLGLFEVYYSLGEWDKARDHAERLNTSFLFPNQVEELEAKLQTLRSRVARQS